MLNISNIHMNFTMIYDFDQKQWKLINVENLCVIWEIKKNFYTLQQLLGDGLVLQKCIE